MLLTERITKLLEDETDYIFIQKKRKQAWENKLEASFNVAHPSKLLESQICSTIDSPLDKNNCVFDWQLGLTKGRSTDDTLIQLRET